MRRVLVVLCLFGCSMEGSLPPPGAPDGAIASPDAAPGVDAAPAPPPPDTARFHQWRGPALAAFAVDGDARVSPVVERAAPFREAIASWDADTPPGSWIEVRLRARVGGAWTRDWILGDWSSDPAFHRHSVDGQSDATGRVDTDTLVLAADADAFAVRVRLLGSPTPVLRGLAVVVSRAGEARPALHPVAAARGKALDVPPRSQMIYPDGGEVWCSPTSTSMVLAYWGFDETVPTAASACYDEVYGGTGNWPFNTAHATAVGQGQLDAVVTRLFGLEQLESLIAADFPVVVSVSWGPGEMPGAPIDSTNGHLLVVRGFDANGDVYVNDPAGPSNDQVRYLYHRSSLDAAWSHSQRTVYLIHPVNRPLPTDQADGVW